MPNKGQDLAGVLAEINASTDDFGQKPASGPNDRSSSGDAPLHKVAIWGDVAAATVLLTHDADVNAAGEDDDTPLHRAVAGGHADMVRLLVSYGADPAICNRYEITPLAEAVGLGDPELVAAFSSKRN